MAFDPCPFHFREKEADFWGHFDVYAFWHHFTVKFILYIKKVGRGASFAALVDGGMPKEYLTSRRAPMKF